MFKRFRAVRSLFSLIQILLYMTLLLVVTTVYLSIITHNTFVSIIVGFITSLMIFHYSIYLPKARDREMYLFKELQKYASNMSFYLQAGNNVLNALKLSKERLDPVIQKDIDKTIKKLQDKAELDTEHFKKYKFRSIDMFHKQLEIKYLAGGNPKDLFSKVNDNINFEIVKRDELLRRKAVVKRQDMMMWFMVLFIPFYMALAMKDLFNTFLSAGAIGIGTNIFLFVSLIVDLIFIQKASTNTSIYS